MATLENVNGASLVPSFNGGLNILNQAFSQRMERKRAEEAAANQQAQIEQIMGGGAGGAGGVPGATPGFNGNVTPEQIIRISQIDPQMAKAMEGILARNDKMEMAQAKANVERGVREAHMIRNTKTLNERMNVVNMLKSQAEAEGRPADHYVELMNMSPDQQEIELERMQVMGTDIEALLAPPKPPETREVKVGDRIVTQQFNPQTGQFENIADAERFNPNAGARVDVSVNTGADKFTEKVAEGDATRFQDASVAGQQAGRNRVQIDQLDDLLSRSGGGFITNLKAIAGNRGINTEGLDDIQAAQALISQLVPAQRPPGSGVMSDADLELFKQSLPRLINAPGGNRKIIDTIRAISDYDLKIGQIANEAMTGNIDRNTARQQMMEVANPLDGFKAEQTDDESATGRSSEIDDLVNKYLDN